MKRIIYLILVFIQTFKIAAQNCQHLYTLNLTGKSILSDQLDNIYLIDGQLISKYDLKGTKLAEYSNKQLGNITSADVSDPFRILLFYTDFNQLLTLDNFLSELGNSIILDQLNVVRTEAVCSSSNNGFWLYNGQENRLQYFDKSLNLIYKSIDLTSIVDSIGKPKDMQEINTLIYINIPRCGLLIFDRFGNYIKTLPFKNMETFQVYGEVLLCLSANEINYYNLNTLEEKELSIPGNNILSVRMLQNNKCIVLKKDKLEVYEIIKP